ncbi:MAG: hypothetical protein IPO45_14200 [Saprospiraceae bacterium]|uniref:hypothetical protein n=1 Tax=Candidatus Brachybacter algidus TaxID=2982024 RepID=UPI001B663735|nr:hypothetical protein [Candidatus Brachybacter algidus]MBP7306440.1 hypothetical protein [Saprospiraceae bacterium]MBK6371813.1 hypothetical protein [Candidatus Brachybacter algidus]MBK6448852.1 hypothetical protein [Candidatus Brachybacter algidus]MBK7603762.1 hypothetical protein [Candidatus Brachybacter algidus]MBK8357183.1 hypothetical protein [Candidatus Brachybacter algidus]
MKYLFLFAIIYTFYRLYKIGLLNGAKNEIERRSQQAPQQNSSSGKSGKEYTDYEEIK